MRIAIWVGGNKGHPYKQAAKVLEAIAISIPGARVATVRRGQILSGNNLKFFDCVVAYTQGGEFMPGEEDLLTGFIASGKGFVGIHGATASFKAHQRYRSMLGGKFTGHKLVRTFVARPCGAPHYITEGMQPFKIKDEPYMHEFDATNDGGAQVIVERVDKRETIPAAWIKDYGGGRVAYIAFGHLATNFKIVGLQRLISRAISWGAGRVERGDSSGSEQSFNTRK